MTKDKYSTYELPSILVKKGIIEVLIVIVTFVLYANTLGHSFTQDDAIAIYDNIYVQDGVSGIGKILTTDSFSGFFRGQDKSSLVAGGRYRPLTMVVFACIHQVVGANPLAYHFFNVLIYALLCVIFYRLLMSIDMNWERKKFQYFVLMTTMIFAVHPIHTEVVANVKGLDEIFSLLFSLLAMKSAISYVHSKNIGRLLIMILCFLSAILSKENAAAFVIIIPLVLLFYTKSSSNKKGILIPSYLLIVSFIAYWILRTRIVGADLGSPLGEMMNNPFIKIEDGRYLPFTSGERWASIIYGMGKYIQLLVFPHPLTHDYYPRHFGVANFAQLSVWMAIIMNVTLGLIALLGLRKRSFISFCIIFFYVTIALMSNVVFPIGTHLSERFLFTPSVAISLIIAYGLVQLRDVRKYQGVVPFLFIGIIAIGSLKTILRNTAWKDDLTLFTTDVKVSTNSAKVQNAAGGALLAAALEEPDEV